ncbi:forkhead box protein N1 [Nerophis lumbriciformis]|uniref:forkhead box protein N1 n=1 Tax=Nerophis lumbriciformis TaxID=546530 RepID=UPI002ADF58EF|nr:forkhead box protein N1-like [Nerophis lumbriciformis]
MSHSSPSRGECKASPHQAKPPTCEPLGNYRQKVQESQIKDGSGLCFTLQARTTFTSRPVRRRHSVDGTLTLVSGQGPVAAPRFHPYLRQCSEEAAANPGCLQHASSSFSGLLEVCGPQTCCLTHNSSGEAPSPWEQNNSRHQYSYSDLPVAPAETSQRYRSFSAASPLQEVASRLYTAEEHYSRPMHSLHSLSSHAHYRSPALTLFPKPAYSYSILIFMALKNSKTGSLPVSQIYSFMTENFPYFKTAPDGWKNSVRHNLSLNKCFEKAEIQNGNSSRKGCLWALNPAKVAKMQEELHKWRRKDPVTVRRSMARPEDLDRLLGDRPNKWRSAPVYTRTAGVDGASFSTPSRRPHYSQTSPPSEPLLHLHQQLTADVQSNAASSGKLPPAYSAAPQADLSVRSLQDFLFEDTSYDVDVLNPSLTDLQLQGNFWEELREDSLTAAPTMPTFPPVLQASCVHPSCVDAILPYC